MILMIYQLAGLAMTCDDSGFIFKALLSSALNHRINHYHFVNYHCIQGIGDCVFVTKKTAF
jgi:hypothetical protein